MEAWVDMAWIKIDVTTCDKTEIMHIARSCGVSVNEAFGAWFRLWAWFDGVTEDGRMDFLKKEDCDMKAMLPGIGAALEDVGWIEFGERGAIIVGWEKHNGKSAKRRAETARRVAAFKARGETERGGNAPVTRR